MSGEKAEAIVIRQADFSESSRVVTWFSKEFGKISVLAKGAKRLKGSFDAAIDVLSTCRIVFITKPSGSLGILTQASMVRKFAPVPSSLNSLYGGYYAADLVNLLTEDEDPAPTLYQHLSNLLQRLSDRDQDILTAITHFEVAAVLCCGLFPNLSECSACNHPIDINQKYAHWVSQGGLLCHACRREEYAGRSISANAVRLLAELMATDTLPSDRLQSSAKQILECHRFAVSAINHAVGKTPGTLKFLKF